MPGDRHQCKRLPFSRQRQREREREKGTGGRERREGKEERKKARRETSNKAFFSFQTQDARQGAVVRGDRIEEWTVFNRSEAHFSTPPSSDKNMIRSNHMDMPHYSMNTISHNASFTHRS